MLNTYVVYKNPSDFPGLFVARRHETNGLWERACEVVAVERTLEAVRDLLPPGLFPIARHELDDPVIVETWL